MLEQLPHADDVLVSGPFALAERPRLSAYVAEWPHHDLARACVIFDERAGALPAGLDANLPDIAMSLWSSVAPEYESLPRRFVVLLHLVPGTAENQAGGETAVFPSAKDDAQALAEGLLANVSEALSVGGKTYLTGAERADDPGGPRVVHLLGPSSYYRMQVLKPMADDTLDTVLRLFLAMPDDARIEGEATLWFNDFRQAFAERDGAMALLAFTRTLGYWRQGSRGAAAVPPSEKKVTDCTPAEITAIGTQLFDLLVNQQQTDYAELVAQQLAEVARVDGDGAAEARAWRMAGMAAENSGDLVAVTRHYRCAIALLDERTTPLDRARVLMSFGISICMCLTDLDFGSFGSRESKRRMAAAGEAEAHLVAARALYLGLAPDHAWAIAAIDCELARLAAVQGDKEGALRKLAELKLPNDDFRLRSAAALYALSARFGLFRDGSGSFDELHAAFDHARAAIPTVPFDRSTWRHALLGLYAAILTDIVGQSGDALRLLRQSADVQERITDGLIRPPSPGPARGGVAAIDILGRAQRTMVELARGSDDHADLGQDAFRSADRGKSRWFARDLLFQTLDDPGEPELVRHEKSRLREMALDPDLDHRIVLSTFDWFQRRYGGGNEDGAAPNLKMLGDASFDEGLKAVLATAPATLFGSFYADDEQTFFYLSREVAGAHLVHVFDLKRLEIEAAAADLGAGINGNGKGLFPLDPTDPDARAPYFRRYEPIAAKLRELVPHLRGAELIVLSLHSAWHDLPVEATLLEALWQEGAKPAIMTVPSLGVAGALVRREAASGGLQRAGVALITAPAAGDALEPFQNAHATLCATLRRSGRPLAEHLGATATGTTLLVEAERAGYLHVLAHGLQGDETNALRAHLLLTGEGGARGFGDPIDPTCTAAAFMAQGTTAAHVTLQACSLGRSRRALGDELWGFSRAGLAAGARTILAPLWDINPASSTALLDRFYKLWLVDKRPPWRALAEAMYEMRVAPTQPAWRHFYHWGALRLTGLCLPVHQST